MGEIIRQSYLDKIEKYIGKETIIVLVGQRRVRKSCMPQLIYVQASYLIAADETRKREFGNLGSIKDNYPKYVISMNPLLTKSDYDGITHIHLRTFLTEEDF